MKINTVSNVCFKNTPFFNGESSGCVSFVDNRGKKTTVNADDISEINADYISYSNNGNTSDYGANYDFITMANAINLAKQGIDVTI